MTPREMLRRYFSGSDYRCDDLMNALHSAGCRILGPGEWDKEADWQPIETAPKDGTRVLVALQGGKCTVVRWHQGFWTIYSVEERGWLIWLRGQKDWLVLPPKHSPTHWRPLPDPPAIRALAKEKQGC